MPRLALWTIIVLAGPFSASAITPKASYWDTQRVGANGGIEDAVDGWFEAAAGFGIEYIRLSASTGNSSSEDFLINAIRKVDTETPIILDSRFHASPEGFDYFEPLKGDGIFYSFHFYSPYNFTTFRINNGRFSYPNQLPVGAVDQTRAMSREDLASLMDPVHDWAKRYDIPNHKIIAAEIGCDRRVGGATQYMADVIAIMNKNDWHWAFYSFRSSSWDGMDYELGNEKLNWKYWQGVETGKPHNELVNRGENPLWEVVLNRLKKEK